MTSLLRWEVTMANTLRTTVYLEPDLHRALRSKAAESRRNVSELVNEAVRAALVENLADIEDFDARQGEPDRPFEAFLRDLARADAL